MVMTVAPPFIPPLLRENWIFVMSNSGHYKIVILIVCFAKLPCTCIDTLFSMTFPLFFSFPFSFSKNHAPKKMILPPSITSTNRDKGFGTKGHQYNFKSSLLDMENIHFSHSAPPPNVGRCRWRRHPPKPLHASGDTYIPSDPLSASCSMGHGSGTLQYSKNMCSKFDVLI